MTKPTKDSKKRRDELAAGLKDTLLIRVYNKGWDACEEYHREAIKDLAEAARLLYLFGESLWWKIDSEKRKSLTDRNLRQAKETLAKHRDLIEGDGEPVKL